MVPISTHILTTNKTTRPAKLPISTPNITNKTNNAPIKPILLVILEFSIGHMTNKCPALVYQNQYWQDRTNNILQMPNE